MLKKHQIKLKINKITCISPEKNRYSLVHNKAHNKTIGQKRTETLKLESSLNFF